MRIRLLFFAKAREIVGTDTDSITLEGQDSFSVHDAVQAVFGKHPKLAELADSMVVSLNLKYTSLTSDQTLKDDDEVAFIPPISGG